jgi:hypothetical protein
LLPPLATGIQSPSKPGGVPETSSDLADAMNAKGCKTKAEGFVYVNTQK